MANKAKATNGRRKAETPIAVKAKGAANIPASKGKELAIVMPKSGAMSADIGLKVAALMEATVRADLQIRELTRAKTDKSYEVQAWLTAAFVKAQKADSSIDLAVSLSDDEKAIEGLNQKLYIATGLKTVQMVGDVGAQKPRVDWTPGKIAEMLKINKKADPEAVQRQKGTFRTNLAHQFQKAQRAALTLIEKDIKFTQQDGTLRLTGPAVQAAYGTPSVLLNEKQTQTVFDKKGKATGEVKLKSKPSFTDIARRAAEARGKVVHQRVDSRTKTSDPNKYLVELCGYLSKALESFKGELTSEATTALEGVQSAIEQVLE